jgi:carbon starvation protein
MRLRDKKSLTPVLTTLVPLLILLAVTGTAGWQKISHENPAIGFLAKAQQLREQALPAAEKTADAASAAALEAIRAEGDLIKAGADETVLAAASQVTAVAKAKSAAAVKAVELIAKQMGNQYLDTIVTATFLGLVVGIVMISLWEWMRLLSRAKQPTLSETDPVWLPESALAPSPSLPIAGLAALGFTLLKEVSGEAAVDRERALAETCVCQTPEQKPAARRNVFLTATEHRFKNVSRCC